MEKIGHRNNKSNEIFALNVVDLSFILWTTYLSLTMASNDP